MFEGWQLRKDAEAVIQANAIARMLWSSEKPTQTEPDPMDDTETYTDGAVLEKHGFGI